jgi:hypothetical protein
MSAEHEPFVAVPLRIRREHADWSNAEHAAWLDLFLASYLLNGVIESLEIARAYLGRRGAALPALVERGALVEVEDGWQLADYPAIYDETRQRRSNAERVAAALLKQERGESLNEAERKAIQRAKTKTEMKIKKEIRVDVTDMSGQHVPDIPTTSPMNGSTNLNEHYHVLTGHVLSSKERDWLGDLEQEYGSARVAASMRADDNPRERGFLGRVTQRLRHPAWQPSPADRAEIEKAHQPREAA